jgi:O-antigen/teichoic acid export membrane protein
MSFGRAVAKNVFFKGLGEALIRLLSFAFVVWVARTLKESDFGALNFAYSFPLLFIILVDFGFNPLMIREISRDPKNGARIFGNLLLMKLGLAIAFVLAVVIGLFVVAPGPEVWKAVLLLTGFMLFNSFTEFITAVFQAHQQMQWEAGVFTWQKLSLLGFGLLALSLGWGLPGVAAAYLAAGLSGLLAAMWVLKQRGLIVGAWHWDRAYWNYALRQALPLTLTTLFINLYFRIDTTLLTKMRPLSEVGWYGAAHKCIEVLMVMPAVLVASTFPGFSKMYVEDRERMQRAAQRVLGLLVMAAVPLVIGAVLLSQPLMILVFGQAYAPSGLALAWLAVALGFIFVNYLLSYLLISAERQRVNAVVSGLAVVVSISANLLLIPRWGYAGAAASAAVTEGFLFVAYAWCVQRKVFSLRLKSGWRIGLAGLVMGGVVWWLRGFHVLPVIAAGALVYGAMLFMLKVAGPEEWQWLREKIKKN